MDKKVYWTKNLLSGSIHIVVSSSKYKAMKKAKEWFGSSSKIGIIVTR